MESYHAWARIFELHRDYYWIVDRFHISARSYQLHHSKRDFQFEWLEERLVALNFHLVHCVRRPESFEDARAERLTFSENPTRYDNLQKFVEEQELMRRLVKESRLPSLEIDISDNDVEGAAHTILNWVESTGGFWRVS